MMIQLMHSGYQLNMQEEIKKQGKLRKLKTVKMNGNLLKKRITGLQVHVFDY